MVHMACIHPLQRSWERTYQKQAELDHSFRSRVNKRVWVHARLCASPAESTQTVYFAHAHDKLVSTSICDGVHLRKTIFHFVPHLG